MRALAVILMVLFLWSCSTEAPPSGAGKTTLSQPVTKKPFGKTVDGQPVDLYTLSNDKGVEATIMNYGAIVVSLRVPDRSKTFGDVVLGFDALDGYLREHPYFGAICGRYANRIAKGRFRLAGVEYKLAKNNGANHLHGGIRGFDKVVWSAREVAGAEPAVEMAYTSKDGEEGYPGNLTVKAVYTLTANNELKIDYDATTDKDTVLNVTNHSYFNLAGAGEGDILGHQLMIAAGKFTPVDAGLIPTGELKSVKGTPFDFAEPAPIGARIDKPDQQLRFGRGYDHNYVLSSGGGSLALAARVREPKSGRMMEVWTTEPGVQLYTGNFLDGSIRGKGGKVYGHRHGFCLETQRFPDSPNQPNFPSAVLKAGERYRSTTAYRFAVEQ